MLKKTISLALSLTLIMCVFSFMTTTVGAEENAETTQTDWLATAEIVAGLRANRLTASLEYSTDDSAWVVNYTGVLQPKNFMFVTNAYCDINKSYVISVDYQTATTGADEAVGFVIGSDNNFGVVSGNDCVSDGTIGANKFKTVFQPYKTSGANSKYLRISSNDATSGNAYDYVESTTNDGSWQTALTLNDNEDWNTISLYVSGNEIKQYVNGTLIRTVSGITVDSGYVGLYSGLKDTLFKNFVVQGSYIPTATVVTGVRATSANTRLQYDTEIDGYTMVSTATNPKSMILVTDQYASSDNPYIVSVDYKTASTTDNAEVVGFIIGNKGKTTEDISGANIFKTMFWPNGMNSSTTPYVRISSNDKAGDPGGNGTTNLGSWVNSLSLESGWNTISLYVSKNELKYYVNDTLIYTANSNITVDSGYIGLYSGLGGVAYKNLTVQEIPALSTATVVVAGARATSANTSLEYDDEIDGYRMVSSASDPQNMILITKRFASTDEPYMISVDYKTATTNSPESVGFVVGANAFTSEGVTGANKFKTVFEPYRTSGANSKYLRISSNDSTTGSIAYNSSTTNSGGWNSSLSLKSGWNTISLYVSNNELKQYVNGTLIKTVSSITVDSGYIGLYSGRGGISFRNFTVTGNPGEITPYKTVVACVGDSITTGVGTTNAQNAYPSQLQIHLGNDYSVSNFGKSGYTAVKGYTKSYMYTDEYARSLESNADIVIIMLGTNDANLCWNTLGTAFYETDLEEMIEAYKSMPSNPMIYLCKTPYSLNDTLNTRITEELHPIQEEVAKEYGCEVIDMYSLLDGKDYLFYDTFHPNDNGYYVMADKFYNVLTKSIYGDVDGDGFCDIVDLVKMEMVNEALDIKYIRANSDIDFDGSVSATDLTKLAKYLLGILDSFE